MNDGTNLIFKRFFEERALPLRYRFPGRYRAVVKETNDPLNDGRVKFACPELHNSNLPTKHLPWAVSATRIGGKGCGDFDNAIIGDVIMVTWIAGHPYAPIWVSAGDATRKATYPLEVIHIKPSVPVNTEGKTDEDRIIQVEKQFDEDYLPKDGRPMRRGFRDRYGSIDMHSSVGFFPVEHDIKPTVTGYDAVQKSEFEASQAKPEINDPDLKYSARITKYGHIIIASDVGYAWKKDEEKDPELGEFTGDFIEDEDFEIERWKYLQRLLNEDEPSGVDQRRLEWRTRYGHKIEARDVGWGTRDGKTRADEFGEPRAISESDKDQRWIKLRTKGGMLIQSCDMGFDPQDDEFIKRTLIEEVGDKADREDKWAGRDARMIRIVTRYGFKFVLDDRGSDDKDAEGQEEPRGNGFLVKGRRGNRGFGLEFNEKDAVNAFRVYSHKGKILELNEKSGYVILCTEPPGGENLISEEWQKLDENEFALNQARSFDPEQDTFHLLLDVENRYLRLKTPMKGGIEVRDGGDIWTDIRDSEDRGFFLSETENRAIWRAKEGKDLFIAIDDAEPIIAIQNNQGRIQIICKENVEIMSDKDVNIKGSNVNIEARDVLSLRGGGTDLVVQSGKAGTSGELHAAEFIGHKPDCEPGGGVGSPSTLTGSSADIQKLSVDKRKPNDRGEAEGDFEKIDQSEITGETTT